MRKEEIRFNWAKPHLGPDNKYHLPSGGNYMDWDNLDTIIANSPKNGNKSEDIWMQFFNCKYRVVSDNNTRKITESDAAKWNGVLFADLDVKHYLRESPKWKNKSEEDRQIEALKIFNELIQKLVIEYNNVFLGAQLSNSKISYHIWFYFDVERTFSNFVKCGYIIKHLIIHRIFEELGYNEIIHWNKVYDNCTNSILQGCYITSNTFILNKNEFSGIYEEFDSIEVEDAFNASNGVNYNDIENKKNGVYYIKSDCVSLIAKNKPNTDKLKYISHPQRRCLYEALVVLCNKDIELINKEWEYITSWMVEGNGHNRQFFLEEPKRNRWYELFSGFNVNLSWLKDYGYTYKDKSDYVFQEEFERINKHNMKRIADEIHFQNHYDYTEIYKEISVLNVEFASFDEGKRKFECSKFIKKWEKIQSEYFEKLRKVSIFEPQYDEITKDSYYKIILNKNEDEIKCTRIYQDVKEVEEKLKWARDNYWRKRFDWKKDKEFIIPYEIGVDTMSYQMFADLYYRDENNYPTVRYDIITKNIECYGKDVEDGSVRWHSLIYDNEYTDWCNNDIFFNRMTKEKFQCAIDKFIPYNFDFDNIKEYFKNLKNVEYNEEKLETYFIRHLLADDTPLNRKMTKNFFIAAVKKQFYNRDKEDFNFQHMLCLQGPSNNGKTFALTKMFTFNGRKHYVDGLDVGREVKDIAPFLGSNMMIQFGERKGLSKNDANTIKQFVDLCNTDLQYQKKYHNEVTFVTPRCVLCMTTNDVTCIPSDSSLNTDKRHWLIEVKAPEYYSNEERRKAVLNDIDCIWYTAYKMYLDNPDIDLELSDEEFCELGRIQDSHKVNTSDELGEYYSNIFERPYNLTQGKFKNEADFLEQLKRNIDYSVDDKFAQIKPFIEDEKDYNKYNTITILPMIWLKNYVGGDKNNTFYANLVNYMKRNGWESDANLRYCGGQRKCFRKKEVE